MKLHHKKRTTKKEHARNLLLILLALGAVALFYSLDIVRDDGDTVFTKSSSQKLRFSGDLKRKDYNSKEIQELTSFIKRYTKEIEQTDISVTLQDSYTRVKPTTQVIFEINMVMSDGTTINTPTWRTTRERLVERLLTKMNKDMKAYLQIKEKGKKIKSLVNTK